VLRLLRWILVPIAAVAGWYVALLVGLAAITGLDSLCPSDQMVSEMCVAPWYATATGVVFALCAALAAALVVAGGVLAAPSHRRAVAWIVFACGALAALRLGVAVSAWVPLACALAGGAASALLFTRPRFLAPAP
jgi:hypothetical protein